MNNDFVLGILEKNIEIISNYIILMITIYIIFHKTFENTNIFTTDEYKITEIIEKLIEKNKGTHGEWSYRKIVENTEFTAVMDM